MKKNYTIRNILFLFLLMIIVFAMLDQSLARIMIKNTDRTFRSAHSWYHHGLLPNQKVIASWYNIKYPLYTNSLGFRDAEMRNIPLQTDKKRILFMGYSHTEGVGVPFNETFTGKLMEKLDTSKIEILNAAAVSYSPRIYYLKTKYLIEEVGLKFDELFVFIDLSDIQNEIVYQDLEPKIPGSFNKAYSKMKNRLVNHSYTVHTLSQLKQNRQTARFLKKAAVFDEYRQKEAHVDALELYASFFDGFDDNTLLSNPQFHGVSDWLYNENFSELAQFGLELGKKNMLKLHQLCSEHGISMTISVHPWQEQIALMQPEDKYVSFWKNFAEEYDIGFINLYPVFINPPVSAALGMEFFIPNDNHWNKNGHWLVTSELEKKLNKQFEYQTLK
ncbi:MAG: hypothetical protein K0B11_07475 [Mariniphaga sp.]|nr:hypothetical protein [Mariniphaga sp.]